MNFEIWNYPIGLTSAAVREMPVGAEILTVNRDPRVDIGLRVYAKVNVDAPLETREFRVFRTGQPIDSDYQGDYVGSGDIDGFVWHLYASRGNG